VEGCGGSCPKEVASGLEPSPAEKLALKTVKLESDKPESVPESVDLEPPTPGREGGTASSSRGELAAWRIDLDFRSIIL
jgi:hypothetical protein